MYWGFVQRVGGLEKESGVWKKNRLIFFKKNRVYGKGIGCRDKESGFWKKNRVFGIRIGRLKKNRVFG